MTDDHPMRKMSDNDYVEMMMEWESLVEEMNLDEQLDREWLSFSCRLFFEAYSRGFLKRS